MGWVRATGLGTRVGSGNGKAQPELDPLPFLSKSTIFDKLPNEVMSNLYVFSSRVLNWILRDVDGTSIVTVDGKMLLTNTIIMEEFLHP